MRGAPPGGRPGGPRPAKGGNAGGAKGKGRALAGVRPVVRSQVPGSAVAPGEPFWLPERGETGGAQFAGHGGIKIKGRQGNREGGKRVPGSRGWEWEGFNRESAGVVCRKW